MLGSFRRGINASLLLVGIAALVILITGPKEIIYERKVDPGPELEIIEAIVTAYSEIDSCHYPNCEMASGQKAYIGAIACPRNLELDTRVIIDNTPYICKDRTNKNLDGRFDIFLGYGKESYQEAKEFGIQKKQVQILQ